ncbi:MAG: TetR/AcrR family transcriptional regulator [Dehalococcoidia bacterium]
MVHQTERADARANRARILNAAVALLAERGIDAEMREIAERAGLAVGTVYNHFPGKDDLIIAVMREAFGELEQAIDAASTEADPVRAIETFLGEALTVAERYGALLAAITEGRVAAPRKEAIDEERRMALGQRMTGIVARGVAEGRFRPDLDLEIATGVISSVLLPWTLTELRRTRSVEQIVAALMTMFLDGARARPPARK